MTEVTLQKPCVNLTSCRVASAGGGGNVALAPLTGPCRRPAVPAGSAKTLFAQRTVCSDL